MSEKHVYIKSFIKKDDADDYLDRLIVKHNDLKIMEADVKYINGQWRVGATFGDGQLELKLEKPDWSDIYKKALGHKFPIPSTRQYLTKGDMNN